MNFSGSIDWDPRNILGGKEMISGWKPGSVSQVLKNQVKKSERARGFSPDERGAEGIVRVPV